MMRLPAFCSSSGVTARALPLQQRSFVPFLSPSVRHHRSVSFNTRPSRRLRRPPTLTASQRTDTPDATTTTTLCNDLKGQKLVITTPLFYANAPPHMGSAYPTIAADALSRFFRLAGASPLFITGCDEHGEKIAAASASTSNEQTQQFVDGVALKFEQLWTKLDVRYDEFVRTTSDKHKEIVRQVLQRVWDNGDIYKDLYDGLYCKGCEEYKVESDLHDGNVCPIHLTECERRTEENYFFKLSRYQEDLERLLSSDNDELNVFPAERRNEVLGWIKSGVRDFSISRANNPWGIPMPYDPSHTIYVWFDALIGYISGLFGADETLDLNNAAAKGWPAHVHIIGKDILRFHAVYWPAMLISAGLPLPKHIVGHGFLTKDGMKMGKSLGNTLEPNDLVDTYGCDAVRFFFLRSVDFGRDGDFSHVRFVDTVNADLANSLGNLLSRSVNLARKNMKDGVKPYNGAETDIESNRIITTANIAMTHAFEQYKSMNFVAACEYIMQISYEANTYIDRVAPWTKFKSDNEEDLEMARQCIAVTLECCRIIAAGLSPVTPQLSFKIYKALGLEERWNSGAVNWEEDMAWGNLLEGKTFAKTSPVFPRMEMAVSDDEPAVQQTQKEKIAG